MYYCAWRCRNMLTRPSLGVFILWQKASMIKTATHHPPLSIPTRCPSPPIVSHAAGARRSHKAAAGALYTSDPARSATRDGIWSMWRPKWTYNNVTSIFMRWWKQPAWVSNKGSVALPSVPETETYGRMDGGKVNYPGRAQHFVHISHFTCFICGRCLLKKSFVTLPAVAAGVVCNVY